MNRAPHHRTDVCHMRSFFEDLFRGHGDVDHRMPGIEAFNESGRTLGQALSEQIRKLPRCRRDRIGATSPLDSSVRRHPDVDSSVGPIVRRCVQAMTRLPRSPSEAKRSNWDIQHGGAFLQAFRESPASILPEENHFIAPAPFHHMVPSARILNA